MIHEFLGHGRGNAIPGRDLVAILQLKDGRELTKLIEKERRCGEPICATTNSENPGYFLAEDTEELEQYIRSLDRRLKNVRTTREACQDTLIRMTGQQMIESTSRR